MNFTNNRQTKRFSCYQPVKLIVSQESRPQSITLINGVILNATKRGFFIQTPSKIEEGKVFFSYNDLNLSTTLFFECNVLRTDPNGIAVNYHILSYPYETQANRPYDGNTAIISKGRFLDRYL